jgi:hypothetical protein
MLREHDDPNVANIDLISINTRFALDRGFTVVLEGILRADHYGAMVEELHRDYRARRLGTTSTSPSRRPLDATPPVPKHLTSASKKCSTGTATEIS